MAGGLFSIDKQFFYKIGKYDPGFDIWGAENLELSLKTWMCGGTLEIIPCSHVGHVFRRRSPYSWRSNTTVVNMVKRNTARLVEVWLDEYKVVLHKTCFTFRITLFLWNLLQKPECLFFLLGALLSEKWSC